MFVAKLCNPINLHLFGVKSKLLFACALVWYWNRQLIGMRTVDWNENMQIASTRTVSLAIYTVCVKYNNTQLWKPFLLLCHSAITNAALENP